MTDIIDKDATVIGDTHRAMFAKAAESRVGITCSCGHGIWLHDDSGCIEAGCDCRKWDCIKEQ